MAIERGFVTQEQIPPLVSRNYQFVDAVLAESNGHTIWQEQVIELLYRVGGFSYAEADLLRREAAFPLPFSQPTIVKQFQLLVNDKRHDIVLQAVFEQQQHTNTSVPALKWMDTIELIMKI